MCYLSWLSVAYYELFVQSLEIRVHSPHFTRRSLRGGGGSGGGAVRVESVLVGGLKGCCWWKTVWRTSELHYYIQTENIIKQLRVACSECTCTVGVVIMFYIESH
jgi:hypothetical protein